MAFTPVTKHIAEHLEDLTTSPELTVGTNLFVEDMPDTPDTCVGVYQYAGLPPDESTATAFERPGVQLIVRAANTATAYDLMYDIFRQLPITSSTIESVYYYRIEASGSAAHMGKDGNDRVRFSLNLAVIKDLE